MNSVIETIFSRRPPIEYVSPAACEVILSGSGLLSLILPILNPFGRLRAPTGVVIVLGDVPGQVNLNWDTTPGAEPPVICYNIYQVVDGELTLVAECVNPPSGGGGVPLPPGSPGGGDTYVVTPVTPEGEGPPSAPVTTPIIPVPNPCDSNEGVDTTCDYGPTGDRYRIKNFDSALFDITDCGLFWTNCVNCEIAGDPGVNCVDAQEWPGAWPVKVNDGMFIDQEFEPAADCGDCFPDPCPDCQMPRPNKLHGFCVSSSLVTSGAANETGCGWSFSILGSFGENVWTGVKTKGEGPVGKYFKVSGCSPGPDCVEVEAY